MILKFLYHGDCKGIGVDILWEGNPMSAEEGEGGG